MKKLFSLIAVCCMVHFSASPALAGSDDFQSAFKDFTEGLITVLKSPTELVTHPSETSQASENSKKGFFKGAFEAPFKMLQEMGNGLTQMLTSPVETTQDEKAEAEPGFGKFKDGLVQILKSPMNFFSTTKESVDESENKLSGAGKGLLHAPFEMLEDIFQGLTDVLSAPVSSD